MDPHCGWCYANSPNISSLVEEYGDKLEFELMVGGMWLATHAPKGSKELAKMIGSKEDHLTNVSGVELSAKYFQLLADSTYTFDSLQPCAAIYWVKNQTAEKTFACAKAVQEAIFISGARLDEAESYKSIIEDLSLDFAQFEKEWMSEENLVRTRQEFREASELANGFPAFFFQKETDIYQLASGYFERDGMANILEKIIAL